MQEFVVHNSEWRRTKGERLVAYVFGAHFELYRDAKKPYPSELEWG